MLARIADELGVPFSRIYGVVTFYSQFYLTRRGKNVIKVCDGTACHVRGAVHNVSTLRHHLGVEPGQTTPDYQFTFEVVYCLGACALGQLTPSPTMSSLRYFRDEFLAHIVDKRCPAGVCKELVYARCSNACPAGQDVPKYVGLIAEGRFEEAYQVITETNPFPSICGRVCEHPCEEKCRRGQLDDAVSIRALKRFVADQMHGQRPQPVQLKLDKRVAVVGGGPAGLAVANSLARMGYQVTIFEALPVLGGMLAVGIPEYRLPKKILRDEMENILALGVEVRTGMALGKDFNLADLKAQGFGAIFLAIGAHKSSKLGVAGEDTQNVLHGVQFLRDVNMGRAADLAGRRVAVVGGGNVAMDAARVALRLGASEVHVVYRRTREEMPAQDEEIQDALAEGIQFHFLVAPTEVLNGTGRVQGLRCSRMVLSDFDRSGRRRPVELKDSDFLQWTGRGTIQADPRTMATNLPGIFAGGDAVSGPATVVEAIAAGNRAAKAIDRSPRSQ